MMRLDERAFSRDKVTIYTVAEKAGVSISTVSRVLNNRFRGKDNVRQRVQGAVTQLGFEPSYFARGLTGRRTQTNMIGVVAPFFTHSFFVEVLKGIYRRLHAEGYHIVLYDVDSAPIKKRMLDRISKEKRLDGLLLVNMHLNQAEYQKLTESLYVTLVAAETEFADSVIVDNYGGIVSGVDYVYELGHRHVGFINNEKQILETRIRESAFKQRAQERGISYRIDYRGVDRRSGYLAAQNLIENNPEVTCLMYYSDLMAYGGLDYLNEHSLRGKVGIVGFDGFEMTFALRLTTIVQPMEEMGARGADLLIRRIRGEVEGPQRVVLDTWLYKGQTSVGRNGKQ